MRIENCGQGHLREINIFGRILNMHVRSQSPMKNILTILLLFSSMLMGAQQSNPQLQKVDFLTATGAISINPVKQNVTGSASYTFDVKSAIDTIRMDAVKMTFQSVKINGKEVSFKENKKELLLFEGFRIGANILTFEYEAFPTQAMYFVNWGFTTEIDTPEEVQGQIWTQGQGKYTSHWFPSFDDVNEKMVFGLDITFHKSFTVLSNGKLEKKIADGDNVTWQYRMQRPMSSYLLMLAIGHFEKQDQVAASGIPLELYYEQQDESKFAATYRDNQKIFNYIEREIGVPYAWEVYRQVPVRDFLYGGMENTSATTFTKDYVVDNIGFNDRNYTNVNAHELAHQWFGDLVTAVSGKDHWLQEGFATYYALLAEREVFGEDYFSWQLYNTAQQLQKASLTDTIPLLNPKASTLSFYQKGAWTLHALRESIGREKFNLAVKNYLNRYAYQSVVTDNFFDEVNKVSDFDTDSFRKLWLEQAKFPEAEANRLLQKNAFIKEYLELQHSPLALATHQKQLLKILKSKTYYPIKELVVYQVASEPFEKKEKILRAALDTREIKVRQAVASTVNPVPESFRTAYETLLKDDSYVTREIALFTLWKSFPEKQQQYVDLSRDWIGFQDRNLQLLHLTLAFVTSKSDKEKSEIYKDIITFTGTNYEATLRQNALERLLSLEIYTKDVFKGLVFGLSSHRWQFVKFSKDTIRGLIKTEKHRKAFEQLLPNLSFKEKTQLQRLLDEK